MDEVKPELTLRGNMTLRGKLSHLFWENKISLIIICSILLVLIMTLPNFGVLIAIVFVITALFIGKKEGSFKSIGFKTDLGWPKTIMLGALLGFVIQLLYSILFDPLIEQLTGTPIDLSNLDNMRGNFLIFLVWLAIGWIIGGFLEEVTFRGYMITRLTKVMGDKPAQLVLIIALTSVSFGIAHLYQDVSGMISTGSFAVIFGIIFIKTKYNLWVAVCTHGFANTVGIFLIYTSWDKILNGLFF